MNRFDGRMLHGPFSKLLSLFGTIGWQVGVVPWVMDHEGLWHDILSCPAGLLHRLLSHAWLWHVSRMYQHRKTMQDLQGIDPALLVEDTKALSPLDSSRLGSVRAGAFLFGAQHCKYDLTQDGLCEACGVPDTVQHRVCHCPCYTASRGDHAWVCEHWDRLPLALTHHLLPPANPHLPGLRRLLHDLDDSTGCFHCAPSAHAMQHLFTDGACSFIATPDFALAAWGVVHAGSEQPVACGLVPGILQTAPRAELSAAIAALRWTWRYQVPVCIWIDAQHVVDGLHKLQAGHVGPFGDNADLWGKIAVLVENLPGDLLRVRHTPSHLDFGLTDGPFEDWLAANNGHADTLAGTTSKIRSEEFWTLYLKAWKYHDFMRRAGFALRSIFFSIHDHHQARQPAKNPDEDTANPVLPALETFEREASIEDSLALNWQVQLKGCRSRFPTDFLVDVCNFVFAQDSKSGHLYNISWLELVFLIHHGTGISFPVPGPNGTWASASSTAFPPLPPTVASRVGIVRRATKDALGCLGLGHLVVGGLDRSCIGVDFVLDGLRMGCCSSLIQVARESILHFTAGRKVGGPNGLARPL